MNKSVLGIFLVVFLTGCHLNGRNGSNIEKLQQRSRDLLSKSKDLIGKAYDLDLELRRHATILLDTMNKMMQEISSIPVRRGRSELKDLLKSNFDELQKMLGLIEFLHKKCAPFEEVQRATIGITRRVPELNKILRDLERRCARKMLNFEEKAREIKLVEKEPKEFFTKPFGRKPYLNKTGITAWSREYQILYRNYQTLFPQRADYPSPEDFDGIENSLETMKSYLLDGKGRKTRVSKQDYEEMKKLFLGIRRDFENLERNLENWGIVKELVDEYKRLEKQYEYLDKRVQLFRSKYPELLEQSNKTRKNLQEMKSRLYDGDVQKTSISDHEEIKLLLLDIKVDLGFFKEKIKEKEEEEREAGTKALHEAAKRRGEWMKSETERMKREHEVEQMRKRRKEKERREEEWRRARLGQ